MKKSCFLLFFIVLSPALFAQTPNEILIALIPNATAGADAWSIKLDSKTGSWVYANYDTTAKTYTLVTPKGTSAEYNYLMQYLSLFDESGNCYTIASRNITHNTYRNYILKNNEIIAEHDYINEGWVEKNGLIYYTASDTNKSYFITYNTSSSAFTKSRPYDEIRLVYFPVEFSEGEPLGEVGFTKDGKPFYAALENNETFIVIGDKEAKHYSDIDYYSVKFDSGGKPCYIAKSKGKLYEVRGNTFVVQGTKQYKKFDWIYGPIVFNQENMPVYVGQDSLGENKYRSTIMIGNEVHKTYNGSVYDLTFSPDGNPVYVVSKEKKTKGGETQWRNSLYVNGKAGKSYSSIYQIEFVKSDPVFVATDHSGKSFVVKGNEAISEKFDYIMDKRYLADGSFAYIGTNYGDYEKRIADENYVFIGSKKLGPFELVSTSDYATGEVILSDKSGNYAFLTGQNTDKENYIYKYTVHTNKWTSEQFDNIYELRLANGKVIFTAGTLADKDFYKYNYRLYVDNQPAGSEYSSISDLKVSAEGVLSFIASRGNDIYRVEVKL
ncbi:MAG: hypothetical protein L0Y79_06535 [Chlorobi bacterium]|nr:hypothetical protein [Chlorobiota bacterium]MCI0716646.1 hypothetical protein [Chlorobiota bacterium]